MLAWQVSCATAGVALQPVTTGSRLAPVVASICRSIEGTVVPATPRATPVRCAKAARAAVLPARSFAATLVSMSRRIHGIAAAATAVAHPIRFVRAEGARRIARPGASPAPEPASTPRRIRSIARDAIRRVQTVPNVEVGSANARSSLQNVPALVSRWIAIRDTAGIAALHASEVKSAWAATVSVAPDGRPAKGPAFCLQWIPSTAAVVIFDAPTVRPAEQGYACSFPE